MTKLEAVAFVVCLGLLAAMLILSVLLLADVIQ